MTDKELLIKIRAGFNILQKKTAKKGRTDWTQEFLSVLKEIGNKEKYKVYTSSLKEKIHPKKGGGEWLFDLCWSIEKEKDGWKNHYKGLKLICECEWEKSDDEILYDFQKLAVGKADLKLMIVQYKGEKQFEKIIKICEKSVDEELYTDGSKYILVGSGNGKNDNEVKWVELWCKN